MSNINSSLRLVLILSLVACAGSAPIDPSPDAAVDAPLDPSGRYAVTSTYSLAAPPPSAAAVLAELRAATDGPDDPSRYLIDLMIERLPDGHVRTYTTALAPYLAAYVNDRLTEVAPKFIDGTRAMALGLSRIAHRFGTRETFELDAQRALRRTITAFQFDAVNVVFEVHGLADITLVTHVGLDHDELTIDRASLALPYTALLRLGLDHAVIPSVTNARDLASALHELVACPHLGKLVANWLGLGSPDFYARACSAGLTALAAKIYARIDQIEPRTLVLELTGTARFSDGMLEGGRWVGDSSTGVFDGARQ